MPAERLACLHPTRVNSRVTHTEAVLQNHSLPIEMVHTMKSLQGIYTPCKFHIKEETCNFPSIDQVNANFRKTMMIPSLTEKQ